MKIDALLLGRFLLVEPTCWRDLEETPKNDSPSAIQGCSVVGCVTNSADGAADSELRENHKHLVLAADCP